MVLGVNTAGMCTAAVRAAVGFTLHSVTGNMDLMPLPELGVGAPSRERLHWVFGFFPVVGASEF